jgi:hypothetical protein
VSSDPAWPNLFVVGAARAATTSLWRYLGQHPEIFMASVKEPHFFSAYRPPVYGGVYDEASYLRLFAGATTPLQGEASPSYLWSEVAAGRIERVSPDAKILIVLRDPVERAHSLFWHRWRLGLERASFAAAVSGELASSKRSHYLGRSRYATDVARFVSLFGVNVRVILFEELVSDVRRALAGVFDFLQVDPAPAAAVEPETHNSFAVPRGPLARRALGSTHARRAARRLVPHELRWPIERRLLETAPKPPLEPDLDRLLTDVFTPEVRELAHVLGRPLPWRRWPDVAAERLELPSDAVVGG